MKKTFIRTILATILLSMANMGFCVEATVASSMAHTVFVDDGNVYGMGLNNYRQSNPNTTIAANSNPILSTESVRTPVYIGLQNVRSVAANGNRSAAIKYDGSLWLWGNVSGSSWTKPYMPINGTGIVTDVALTTTALYFVVDGQVYTWAFTGNPVQVSNPNDGRITSIAAGDKHVLALYANGTVASLGTNANGQLGRGPITTTSTSFVKVTGINDAVEVAANGSSSVVRTSTAVLWVFGKNSAGQLGLNNVADQLLPASITGAGGVKKVTVNYASVVLLMNDKTVKAAGNHNYIAGAVYNSNKTFVTLPGITDVLKLHASGQEVFVDFGTSGLLRGWGGNAQGQLGDATITERHNPTYAYFTKVAAYIPPYVAPVPPVVIPPVAVPPVVPTPPATETGTCGSIYSNPFSNAGNSNNNGHDCQDNGNHGGTNNGNSNSGNGNGNNGGKK